MSNNHFQKVFYHLYISPLEKCNLHCKICYTRKTNKFLAENEIIRFVDKYEKTCPLETITFCGGEVFTLPYFTGLVNLFIKQGKFIQIITNGTIDRLEQLKRPNSINLIISLDGLPYYHDQNRGKGNYNKSLNFLKKANRLGFHTEVFSIVTRQNYHEIGKFENNLRKSLGYSINITYHPRKPISYLSNHPVSNIKGKVEGFNFLTKEELMKLMKEKNTFPSKKLGCYQIALMSDGKVYGCCEGTKPLGNINDKIETLFSNMHQRLENNCLKCSQPDFVCGIKDFI